MMRRLVIFLSLAGSLLVAVAMATDRGEGLLQPTYLVVAVKGKLLRELPEPEERLQVASEVAAGNVLRTGWRSSAEIVSPEAGARFVVASRTRIRLADDRPGVLLEVQKGRLRALFDKITEGPSAERIITTPSAILAVRGTEYGVAVSKAGDTSVVVFSGVVDVTDLGKATPTVSISAGQFCNIPRGGGPSQPMSHMMNSGDWSHGQMPGSMSGHGGDSMMGDHGSGRSGSHGSMGHGG